MAAKKKVAKKPSAKFLAIVSSCGDFSQAEVLNEEDYPSAEAAKKAVDNYYDGESPEYMPNKVWIVQIVSEGGTAGFQWK